MFDNDPMLDGLFGHLISLKLSNYDNSVPKIENGFKFSLSSKKEKTIKDESDSNLEEELDEIEAVLAGRLLRGKWKFKAKLPLIYFKCKEFFIFSARYPKNSWFDKNDKEEKNTEWTRTRRTKGRNYTTLLTKE